ncbi:MAG TPA: histone deacetylase family protein [Devosiaceae bacterium]
MTTLYVSQPNGGLHKTPEGHPECAARLVSVDEALMRERFMLLDRESAETGDLALSDLVHAPGYLSRLQALRPAEGLNRIDEDTFIAPGSLDAAATAIGAGLIALEAVILGRADNAFCGVRPPGHHAEIDRPMGFCLFNTIAIVARQAQRLHGAERIAIVDFDVHHGNGTQDIFKDDPSVLYASSHEYPLYPGTGAASETGVGNIFNAPLASGTDGQAMREAYRDVILPAVDKFAPDIILVSAGFDADHRDPLADLHWVPADFAWITGKLMDIADKRCEGRVVSLLEGGYDMAGLSSGVSAHVGMMLNGTFGNHAI